MFKNLVTTPVDRSIVFLVDTDMVTYPGFLNKLVKNTVLGKVSLRCAPSLLSCYHSPLLATISQRPGDRMRLVLRVEATGVATL